jgi:hypothetical protein
MHIRTAVHFCAALARLGAFESLFTKHTLDSLKALSLDYFSNFRREREAMTIDETIHATLHIVLPFAILLAPLCAPRGVAPRSQLPILVKQFHTCIVAGHQPQECRERN